ncbi:MAG: hypothetical protein FWD69_05045 [Polyangiaceae bacterium]|nr:hypothetical protein [Polyangiaceae bacterium]
MKHAHLRRILPLSTVLSVALVAAACAKKTEVHGEAPSAPLTTLPAATFAKIPRADFNRLAVELALPIFWTEDKNENGTLDPDELAVYWGMVPGATLAEYVDRKDFTPKFKDAYDLLAQRKTGDELHATGGANSRIAAIVKELAQGRITLVATDLSTVSEEEKRFVSHIMKAADLIEKLYARQKGVSELAMQLKESSDPESRALFFRNQGPDCVAPLTQDNPYCSAIPNLPKAKRSGLYPKEMLSNPKFCEILSKKEEGKKEKTLMSPFTVVTGESSAPAAVPYHEFYKDDVNAIADQLKAAADALGTKEPALRAYLLADAQSFTKDEWWPADEAWAKMDANNSKYYLRIAPDEVYAEPCSTKALFHVSFGLINQGSLKWQRKLDPLKGKMEKAIAGLAGAPYVARNVSFKLPDFVDIVINAGDSRPPSGATIGQSLPNFGPVANEGRGRTVAMTNFYKDPDSIATLRETTNSLFCREAMAKYTSDQEPQLMSTVLHEATHNLGPSHQYMVNGKIDREAFGGPLASTLEELKAQTGALFLTDWLAENKEITRDDADKAHVRDIVWAFGHISRGMYDDNEHPKNYSQLAAIQFGWLMDRGVALWHADEVAANGRDKGCFEIVLDKFPEAAKSLMIEVLGIKARGDRTRAEKLIKDYVDVAAASDKKKIHGIITERVLRAPKASFVYSVKL